MSRPPKLIVLILFAIFLIAPLYAQADLPGELLVNGPEGTQIFIDGEPMGVITNGVFSISLLEGEYELLAKKDGEIILTKSIEVIGGETTVVHLLP